MPAYPSSSTYPSTNLFPSSEVTGGGTGAPGDVETQLGSTGSLILCDANGSEVADLEVAHTMRFELNRAVSVKFHIGFDENGAADLLNLMANITPRLCVWRNRTLIVQAYWAPQTDTLADDSGDGMDCEFRSPFARLETRYTSQQDIKYRSSDSGFIAWDLIDKQNQDMETGLSSGTFQNTVPLDRDYTPGQQVSQAITDITDNVLGAFQFTETPVPPGTGKLAHFNVWNGLGSDLSKFVQFEFGKKTIGNVLSVGRTINLPINRVVATGAQDNSGNPLVSIQNNLVSQGKFGLYTNTVDFSTISDQTKLDNLAKKQLYPDPIIDVTFEPDIESSPAPFDDYFIGDTVSFRVIQDSMNYVVKPQITAIEIDRDGDGLELAHRLEFGLRAGATVLVPELTKGRIALRALRRTGGKGAQLRKEFPQALRHFEWVARHPRRQHRQSVWPIPKRTPPTKKQITAYKKTHHGKAPPRIPSWETYVKPSPPKKTTKK